MNKTPEGKLGVRYKSSLDCNAQVLIREGVAGLYRGLSASMLEATGDNSTSSIVRADEDTHGT